MGEDQLVNLVVQTGSVGVLIFVLWKMDRTVNRILDKVRVIHVEIVQAVRENVPEDS